ncbi:hypothetical protein [Streptomyces sp. Tue6028]|uniref:hypothetical protein n=1 Tax=Streptomyces sp. Tue6028 TaxID=2036037 RepID=UPI00211CD87C|nr:hypothetical protein [Streptomyces sp. Tue6028]
MPERPEEVLGLVAGIVLGAALLGLLLRPFQVRAVRVLEGYWDRWPLTAPLAGILVRMQRRRRRVLRARVDATPRGDSGRRVQADAYRRLAAWPPPEALLPTALGNALRAGELSAGERYGLTTLSSWPRIYLQVSDRMAAVLSSTRDALDSAVNLCWSFLALTGAGATAMYDEPSHWWLCGAGLVLVAVAYKGAVTAAQAYAGLMHAAYDLHRFDLLEALHYPLPTREDEEDVFAGISALFAGAERPDIPYSHQVERDGDARDGDGEPL